MQYRIDRISGHSFLKNYLRQGLVIDLGMNKGDFASAMHSIYGCSVHGVEANPVLALTTSRRPGIICKHAAITTSDGVVQFAIDESNSEASHIVSDIVPMNTPMHSPLVTVPSVSLATLFHTAQAEHVDLLKVDIEGAELDIISLENAEFFQRCTQISVEFHLRMYPAHADQIVQAIDLLSALGFYVIDFSTDRSDVLFVNSKVIDLTSKVAKGLLIMQKYYNGMRRRGHRLLFGTRE